jgi:F-type H+-transporting ATPase subunit b
MDFSFLLSNPPGRMFGLDQQMFIQMLFIFINVSILALILSKLLYKPIINILANRRERIQKEVAEAEQNRAEAIRLKAEYEQIMSGAEQEKYDILETARKMAADKSKEQIAEARVEADALRVRAHKEIEMEQERAKSEMRQAVIDVSSVMVAKFLTRTIDEETQQRLFDEAMAELEELAWHN